jgi:hypothetical protein
MQDTSGAEDIRRVVLRSRVRPARASDPSGVDAEPLRLRGCASKLRAGVPRRSASPRAPFTSGLCRGSLPAAVCAASTLRAASIARNPCSRRAFGMHASQWRRRRLSTGSPHSAHEIGLAGRASTVGVRHPRVAYGRGCEALRGVASSGDRSGPGTLRRLFSGLPASLRSVAPLLRSDSRNICARPAAIGRRHSRQCGSVSASSCAVPRFGKCRSEVHQQRREPPQSQLGARASGPARRGVVQARDRSEARRVFA